ncbi:ANTAR domain-containing protein [Streptomyces sp. NRRL S-244]|uniref:ANTAR domain-containing protein n=1 Tax=Streptomyces sp. NRRL S-244 TaxID=1463897 RepID=UPI0004BE55C6|nr:ANTAR domain-containing protein [Streptomyces sp. NRRL S-244]
MAGSPEMATVLADLRPDVGSADFFGGDPTRCAIVLGFDGIAVSLTTSQGFSELVWSSPGVSARFEDLQFTLGQGPAWDAAAGLISVTEPDLHTMTADRWPVLVSEAVALGVRTVFCMPLHLGGACLGTVTFQRATPGPMTAPALLDARLLAAAMLAVILDKPPTGQGPTTAGEPSNFHRAAVHQATGMISVQAGVTLAQALLLLRAYSYRHDRPVADVAADVVARRVHFREQPEPDASGRTKE